jgi:hypothetical protein
MNKSNVIRNGILGALLMLLLVLAIAFPHGPFPFLEGLAILVVLFCLLRNKSK